MTGEEAHWAGLGPEDAEMDLTAGSFKGEKRGLPIAHRDERSQEVETLRAQLAEAQEQRCRAGQH